MLVKEKFFDYDNVVLIPDKCEVKSRSEVNASLSVYNQSTGKSKTYKLPVVPANMSSIVNTDLAVKLAEKGYFYIMHRFGVKNYDFAKKMYAKGLDISLSVGVSYDDVETIEKLIDEGICPDFVTVDVAHGHSDFAANQVKRLKEVSGGEIFVIAGNVCTPKGAEMLSDAGADGVKIGVGPGSACLTTTKTGFGSRGWQASAVYQCSDCANLVIADGGIRNYGDIVKSLVLGADMVMIGGLFAGHIESPGEVLQTEGGETKLFYGSASKEQKGHNRNVEGKSMLVPMKGSIFDTLQDMEESLQSAVSYAGMRKVSELAKAKWGLKTV